MEDEPITVSNLRGNVIYSPNDGETWVWADTQEVILDADSADNRPCACCGELPTEAGHDACLGLLPGVRSACCGHAIDPPYIQFDDEDTFRAVIDFLKYDLGKDRG